MRFKAAHDLPDHAAAKGDRRWRCKVHHKGDAWPGGLDVGRQVADGIAGEVLEGGGAGGVRLNRCPQQ